VSDSQPPAWNPENPQPPYGSPPPQPPQHRSPPPQYGAPIPQPQQQPQYGGPPQRQYGGPPLEPYYGQPHQPPQHGHHQQPAKRKVPWLLAGGIALVLALIGGAGVLLATRGGDEAAAGDPMPTATYSDGLTSGSPSPTQIPSPTAPPSYTPAPTPTPVPPPERRRTLRDIDEGIKVYDDVYVKPATGWRKDRSTQNSVTLGSRNRPGAVLVVVSPVGLPARVAVGSVAQALITADHLKGVRKALVKTVSPANSNIGSQAQLSYSGRYTAPNGAVFSLVAKCTTMTGVESIHNVTATLCVAARKDAQAAVFRDGDRMLASIARSI
jgi:hypothetical protein